MQPILFMIFLYALVNMLNLLEHCVLSCVAIINPRRMRRRVTVVVFVCVSVCLSVCSSSTHFVVDLHGPSKVPTSFKRYSLALNNMDYA